MSSDVKKAVIKLDSLMSDFVRKKSKILDNPEFDEILTEYNKLAAKTDFQELQRLDTIQNFKKYVAQTAKKNIESALKKRKLSDLIRYTTAAVRVDSGNLKLLEKLSSKYKEFHLYNELNELYKINFIYTSDTKYLEKMGDIDCIRKDYEAALDNYLGYAETSDPTPRIYKKLAKVFEKLGDKESEKACLDQVKMLESGNG